jgi:hypothetical protein
MGMSEGTLWEKWGTLRTPCGDLVENPPQGSRLLPQGVEGDGLDLVAIFGKVWWVSWKTW